MSIPDRFRAIKGSLARPQEGVDSELPVQDLPYAQYAPGAGKARMSGFMAAIPPDVLVIGVVALAASAAFGLGMLAQRSLTARPGEGITVTQMSAAEAAVASSSSEAPEKTTQKAAGSPATATVASVSGPYVASKSGKAFYLTTCSGAKRIKEENKVYFQTESAAKAAGYSPALTCKGL